MDARERLHRVNRAPGAIAALRRVRRLLPGDPQFGDPLSTAGQGSASTVAAIADTAGTRIVQPSCADQHHAQLWPQAQ